MASKRTISKPRGFVWVIPDRLAVSTRVGGHGFRHRRVRREQEIGWLVEEGVNAVVSLLAGQNLRSYEEAGMSASLAPVDDDHDEEAVQAAFRALREGLAPSGAKVLLHRDFVDDTVGGVLAGYLVYSGLVRDPRLAAIAVQQIIGRPLGPRARALIPVARV